MSDSYQIYDVYQVVYGYDLPNDNEDVSVAIHYVGQMDSEGRFQPKAGVRIPGPRKTKSIIQRTTREPEVSGVSHLGI